MCLIIPERCDLLCIKPFVVVPRQVALIDDWNTCLILIKIIGISPNTHNLDNNEMGASTGWI